MGVDALEIRSIPVPFELARAALGAVGVKTRMPGREAYSRLLPAADSIVEWTLGRIAAAARGHGAVPVFVALDNVKDPPAEEMRSLKDAEAAGLLVFDLLGLWQDRDQPALRIAEWDEHPNPAGNRVIAERLFELMQEHRSELRLPSDALH